MIEKVVTMKMTGKSEGSVTYRKRPQVLAPSMVADSCSSMGMVCRPARIEMPKNGRPRQVFTMMTEIMAMVGLPSHENPVFVSPLVTSRRLKGPSPRADNHLHRNGADTGGPMKRGRSRRP